MKWKIWSVISNSHFSRTTNLQTCIAYHFKYSSIISLFPLGKYIFDYAVFDGKVHILQHLSFILVGMLLFLCTRQLGESLTLYLLVSSVGMMILSGLVLALANGRIYVPYTISNHNVAGEYMLAMSIAIAVIFLPVYLIRRTLLHIRTITK
jgi:hypothetical protein